MRTDPVPVESERRTVPEPLDVVVQGLRLRLWDHGGEGEAVLFLHGYLDTGRSFDAVVASLPRRVRALCLDWRGHGQSSAAGEGGSHHLLDHLKDLDGVVELLRERGISLAATVAHSMGGNVALLYAGSVPEHTKRLLLVDSIGAPAEDPAAQPERLGAMLAAARRPRPFAPVHDLDEGIARVRRANPGLSEAGARRMVAPALMQRSDGQWDFPFDPRLRGPTPVRWPEEMWLRLCERVSARVSLLRAEQGYIDDGDPAVGRRCAALRATVTTLSGAGHHLHVEHPAWVASGLEALLAGS